MTAIELLDNLRVLGVALWLEDGKLRLFAPDQSVVPQELLQHLNDPRTREAVCNLIRREYVCWRCESTSVRFDVELRRFVCEGCRRVLSDPLDPFPPLPELLLQAGEAYGFPELRLLPHVTLLAGRDAWQRFCFAPHADQSMLLLAYRKLIFPAEQAVDIDDQSASERKPQHHEREEVNDTMKIRWQPSEPLPTGEYLVKVEGVTEQEGRFGTQLRWELRILDPEHEGRTLTAWTNTSTSTNSKLARWCAALGFAPHAGEELDTAVLQGRKAVAVVVARRAEDGALFNRVEDLLPCAPAKARASVAAARDPFADEEEEWDG